MSEPPSESPATAPESGEPAGESTHTPGLSADETVAASADGSPGPTTPGSAILTLDHVAAPERGGKLDRLGPYRLLERIGQGGMGVVYKAKDERLNRVVAVKMLASGLADGVVSKQRFMREARAAAAVSHDHVVTIHAVDEIAGQPYIVMQLVDGESLQQKLDHGGPLAVSEVVRIGSQIAAGLAAAHAQGLVHRDIKPANILIETATARIKITDFGLARAVDDASLTDSGTLAGTPNFMSPEQARGEPVDATTDLFSLGSVLYSLCTGQLPFRAESTVAVLRKVSDEPPQPIRELSRDVPDWLAAVIAKLMAKAPAERYQSAALVSELLARNSAELSQAVEPVTELIAQPVVAPSKTFRNAGLAASLISMAAISIGLFLWWRGHTGDQAHEGSDSPATQPEHPSPPDPPAATSPKGLAKALTRDPIMSKTFSDLAAEAAKKREQKRALELYDEAIRRDPENTAALLARASILSSYVLANWSGAIADATEAIKLEPKNARAYELRARARVRSTAFRGAIDDATESIRLDPARVEAYSIRGAAYNALGEWRHAIVDWDNVLPRDPAAPWSWFERATAYSSLNDQDRALSDINHAIELDRNINQFWFLRGRIHTAKHQYEQAVADFDEAVRVSPEAEKSNAHRNRGDMESAFNKPDRAISAYSEAIRLRGDKIQKSDSTLYIGAGPFTSRTRKPAWDSRTSNLPNSSTRKTHGCFSTGGWHWSASGYSTRRSQASMRAGDFARVTTC